jgi:two-component system, NtrC family, nitrogen regulation sensor histidine kinase NtrY
VKLRRRFLAYLVVVHVLLAASAAFLIRQDRLWLVAVEGLFLLTFIWGVALVSRLSGALAGVRESAQLLEEGELTTRFREAGHPDVDLLVRVYNRMADRLRDERVTLQEQQYFLGSLLDVSPSGVIILDHEGRVSSANSSAERLLGRPASALVGRPLSDDGGALALALAATPVGEATVVPLQGGRRVRCQSAAFIERGFPRRFYLVEELTEELRQSEKAAYEKLIRQMSHEVNNSVGATRSLLQSSLTYAAALPPEERKELEQALGVATARLERLNAFMRSFADVIRLPQPRLQPTDVDALVDGCVTLMQAHAAPSRVTWRRESRTRLGLVPMDPAQMEQALINVLKNAVEAAGDDGVITVRLDRDSEGCAIIEIEDSGPGIGDEARAHLFTPFFTTKQNGQGIGLTIVQEILRRHGFDYALDGPAGGPTRFRITVGA